MTFSPTVVTFVLVACTLWQICNAQTSNLTSLVNLFIGTATAANGGSGGNGFPGAAIPHSMAKVGIDVSTSPRQAGYIADNSSITGISLLHDEGTGGNVDGGYGVFPLFPLTNCTFVNCPVGIDNRSALRAAGADNATPGYFTTTFVNDIKIEATSTRRAGLIRFTYPESTGNNSVVVDLTNDLGRSFHGGSLSVVSSGRVMLQGTFLQSYGESNYTAYACYDFQPIPVEFGTYNSSTGTIVVTPALQDISYPYTANTQSVEAGALLSFNSTEVLARFGVSMISSSQACTNAEEEITSLSDWDVVQEASRSQWEDLLSRVQVDVAKEDATIVELLYSSIYRASLVPSNMTGENPYWANDEPFFDSMFCSWDTFRTVHPWLSLTSPVEWSQIVNAYVDGWRNTGYIPECRANTKAGYVQGGSDGMPILGDFAVKYGVAAGNLGVDTDDLYQALVDTAENTPPNWYTVGRQNTAWKTFDYIPTDWVDPSGSTGLPTREASRAFEYAVGDFAVRQAAIALQKSPDDVMKYENRSFNFVNHWDPSVEAGGFSGFAQRRYPNGTFAYSPPDACSPVDPTPHSCVRGTDNDVGFYESSSWEMSFFAPQSIATLVDLMGGNDTFVNRVEYYFSEGYFQAGNEPSFLMPWITHYAGRPDLSALRVRQVVYDNFNTDINGLPGNDDSGAMAALLIFHILGMYPVTSSKQLLIGSPLVSSFSLYNPYFDTTTNFTVNGFDSTGLASSPPNGSRVYVTGLTINGEESTSICAIDWDDVVGGGSIVISVDGDADAAAARGCGSGNDTLPDSLGTGGFTS